MFSISLISYSMLNIFRKSYWYANAGRWGKLQVCIPGRTQDEIYALRLVIVEFDFPTFCPVGGGGGRRYWLLLEDQRTADFYQSRQYANAVAVLSRSSLSVLFAIVLPSPCLVNRVNICFNIVIKNENFEIEKTFFLVQEFSKLKIVFIHDRERPTIY